ncbi:MAG: response regulator [Myxococcaceae bacterium]|nr:response regulator [Myxococcaceae bacterium]
METQPLETTAGRQVLVVDGDASSRSILEVSLKRAGFEVTPFTTGREALAALHAARALPQVVVLSSELNGEDGYSLCAQLRADPRTAKLPVLLLARGDDDEKGTLAEVAQADELVAKPAFARDVAALVSLWVSPRDASGARVLDASTQPLAVTLRALLSTQRAGQLKLGRRTFIAYRAGRVTHAETDGLMGADALVRALTLGRGPYQVVFTIPTVPATLDVSLRDLVNVFFPRIERWEALAARSVPLEARFQVDFAALAKALPTIPDAANTIVRLFDGQRSVRQVLFDSPLNETITLEVVNRLQLMAIIKPAQAQAEEIVPKVAPRLFEPRETEAEERMSTLFGAGSTVQEPNETPLAEAADWYQPPKGTGLEVENATDGWVEQQLSAFNIEGVVEAGAQRAGEREVAAFAKGGEVEAREQPTLLEQAIAPIQLTGSMVPMPLTTPAPSVEDQFFEDTDPSVKTVPVPAAIEDTYTPGRLRGEAEPEETLQLPREGSGSTKWLMAMIGASLAVIVIGLITWQVTEYESGEPAFVAPPIVLPEPPKPVEAVAEEPKLEVPEVTVTDAQLKAAMEEATKQYDEGQFGEAIATLEQVAEVAPSNVECWMLLAMARLDNSENARAEEAALTALALDPNRAEAFLLLATLHIRQGKRDVAAGEIARYLELEPNGKHAAEAKQLLRR